MKATDFISAIKEFFLEILGFIIPGFIAILILSICVREDFFFQYKLSGKSDAAWPIIIVLAYVLGYIIYALATLKESVMNLLQTVIKVETTSTVRTKIEGSPEYAIVKSIFLHQFANQANPSSPIPQVDPQQIAKLKLNDYRSLAMSYAPEADTKVYNFMFRSELCNQLSILFFIIAAIGLICVGATEISCKPLLLLTEGKIHLLYWLLLVSSLLLHKPRIRFYDIAMRIPLSIFIAKFYKMS